MEVKYLSIIIPAYNEEERIVKTLEEITSFMSKTKISYELIVVDDGSKDKTYEVTQNFFSLYPDLNFKLLKNSENLGKGAAVRKGILNATGKLIYFTDADLSTPIEEIMKFKEFIEKEGYDIVIGSRAVKGAKILIHQPFYREMMGRLFNKIVKILVISDFNDTQCGAKMFKNEVAKKVFSLSTLNNFAFDVEILFIAKKLGYKIKEIPVVWRNSPGTKVKLGSHGFEMLISLFKIRFNRYRWT
jgi:dolichyl-phosphate beta-glucosyltransferase